MVNFKNILIENTIFIPGCELRPDLNGALFVTRYEEQKSGSGRRKLAPKKYYPPVEKLSKVVIPPSMKILAPVI